MTIYLSGPMTDYKQFNFKAFDDAKAYLEKLHSGFTILSPADHDRELGYDFLGDPANINPEPFPLQKALLWDLHAVATSDVLYMMNGWHRSAGARLEHDFGRLLGKVFWFQSKLAAGPLA